MAFTTEAEAYKAFGLTPPEEPDPDIEVIEEGAEEPAAEEPAAEERANEQPEGGQAEAPEGEGGEEDPLEVLRRQLTEQHQRELADARAEEARKQDERIATMGLKNPFEGNKPITTWAEYEAFRSKSQEQQWGRIAQQTGMSREALDKLIAEHPEVRKGLEAQAQAQAAREEAEQAQLRARLDADIRAIAAECPEVKDINSLVAHQSYAQVEAKMKAVPGLGVADAFFLVNRTQLAAGKADGSAQRVRNNLAGKGHMQRTVGQGTGGVHMTAEQERWYRRLLPNATPEQIRKHHESMNKK